VSQRADIDTGLAVFAFLVTPLLWPAAFWASFEWLSEDIMDPLLWAPPMALYVPALMWLGLSLSATAAAARVFRLQRTNRLYLVLSAVLAAALVTCLYVATRVAVVWQGILFCATLALVTGAVFILLGGLRFWKRGQAN
jgi:hypothetical protein